ncbi:hypothetical protein [Pseudogemmobacter faecipullorum]|uniref:Phage minor structural protein GP20 n=1 Tax=Pseudogemmobacter faecipullorum TaxID=2755041 RepID=A0ABS8CQZ6_9RHOB|nr:hypothetical protein [Pseudogemmobacter faecipullorum]MCB5411788.1 hypothetical protein [Pseudogemmobacter faecipullorum]
MALKTVVETLDGLDEAVKALYVEKDGKHILDLDGIDTHPEVANLKSAYERVKAEKVSLKTEADKAKNDLAEAMKGKPDEAALVAERNRYEATIAELNGKLSDAQGKLSGVTIDQALTAALAKAGVTDPGLQAGALAIHRDKIKIGDDGALSFDTPMGPKDVPGFITGWAGAEGKSFVTPPAGGGSKGSESQNGGKAAGDMGGDKAARVAALKAKFPDLT